MIAHYTHVNSLFLPVNKRVAIPLPVNGATNRYDW